MPFSTPMPGFSREVEQSLLGGSLASMRWISGMDYASYGRDRTAEEDRAQGDDTALARWSTPDMQASSNNDTQGGSDAGGSQGGGFSSIYAAQTEATNAILTSLGQGNYEGNEDQFLQDLESIQNWDQATWIDPTHGCQAEYTIPWAEPFRDGWSLQSQPCGESSRFEELCSPVPCLVELVVPTREEANDSTPDLFITRNAIADADDVEDLIRCAWTILIRNEDIIRFVCCALSGGDRGDGDCIMRKITNQEPRIDIRLGNGKLNAQALPTMGSIILGPIGLALEPWTFIEVYTSGFHTSAMISTWMDFPGGRGEACGAVALAGLLLHEISHLCVRDVQDTLFSKRECPFAEVLQNTFLWMAWKRYKHLDGTTDCCWRLDDDRSWYGRNRDFTRVDCT